MNNQLISLSDESLDGVAGGALVTIDATGAAKAVAHGVAEFGEAVFGLGGALYKAGKQIVGAVGHVASEIISIK
ncbi:MAG: hypothetical protein RL385_3296 [Pseudomonadota bacterium]|jgi:hypothetical protein